MDLRCLFNKEKKSIRFKWICRKHTFPHISTSQIAVISALLSFLFMRSPQKTAPTKIITVHNLYIFMFNISSMWRVVQQFLFFAFFVKSPEDKNNLLRRINKPINSVRLRIPHREDKLFVFYDFSSIKHFLEPFLTPRPFLSFLNSDSVKHPFIVCAPTDTTTCRGT